MPLINSSIRTIDNSVSHTWHMAVPADRLWWALTDPVALPQWLGKLAAGRFVAGDVVKIQHAADSFCTSRIMECEPERRLQMTWEFPDEPLSTVLIRLAPEAGGTRMDVMHEGLGDETRNYLPGWHTHLLYLEALLLGQPRSMNDFWPTYEELSKSETDFR
ncbi:SRPBCC domain-containing protein [Arthrobacter bussei]|uniref:Activator of Hsp90 ATPase homologue 1/2-like C-terminal domain-containing protein n=1 Tax=Arthrobacter bussei TaxID=2594179 RepID=A0A7X1NSK0_9MICC|nr:SRPBCC domain-containing protein [Arthrobacter bussei]MPY12246.1 hypothetical protein [Arthrobacter bussei]